MLKWKRASEELPPMVTDDDWNESGECLVRDDWNSVQIAYLRYYVNEWDNDIPPEWVLKGRDAYLFHPKGEMFWILLDDLLREVEDAESD